MYFAHSTPPRILLYVCMHTYTHMSQMNICWWMQAKTVRTYYWYISDIYNYAYELKGTYTYWIWIMHSRSQIYKHVYMPANRFVRANALCRLHMIYVNTHTHTHHTSRTCQKLGEYGLETPGQNLFSSCIRHACTYMCICMDMYRNTYTQANIHRFSHANVDGDITTRILTMTVDVTMAVSLTVKMITNTIRAMTILTCLSRSTRPCP